MYCTLFCDSVTKKAICAVIVRNCIFVYKVIKISACLIFLISILVSLAECITTPLVIDTVTGTKLSSSTISLEVWFVYGLKQTILFLILRYGPDNMKIHAIFIGTQKTVFILLSAGQKGKKQFPVCVLSMLKCLI